MVKFLKRILNRRYKGKDHGYVRYLLEFPAKLNGKIEAHADKVFDEVDITLAETAKVLNISLVRSKPEQTGDNESISTHAN